MITYENLLNYDISNIIVDNPKEINIIGIATITKYNWGRLDKIIYEVYGKLYDVYLLSDIILAFNGINDISEIKLGMRILLPSMESITHDHELNIILDNNYVPGVNNRTLSDNLKNTETIGGTAFQSTENLETDFTVANPKLNIKLKKVSYNPEEGKITF